MIARDMKPYSLYHKIVINISPTGNNIYGWNKIAVIDLAISYKGQYVDNNELNYRLVTLTGITTSDLACKDFCLLEGTNTPQTIENITGFRIVEVNPYARFKQLVLEDLKTPLLNSFVILASNNTTYSLAVDEEGILYTCKINSHVSNAINCNITIDDLGILHAEKAITNKEFVLTDTQGEMWQVGIDNGVIYTEGKDRLRVVYRGGMSE